MPVTPEQKKSIDAVLSVNETGKLPSPEAYSTVTVLADRAGITYGLHQSTDHSGSLDSIVLRYIDLGGALGASLRPYLDELESNASTALDPKNLPAWTKDLMNLLAEAGKDPVMQRAQDEIFDEQYWTPAVQRAAAMKLQTALAHLVLYDTCIHSGPGRIDALRKKFPEASPASGGDEHAWVKAFLNARRAFLSSNPNPVVQKTVYRIDSLRGLVDAGNWSLATPFTYRGKVVKA